MDRYRYVSFLSSASEYEASEQFWNALFVGVFPDESRLKKWVTQFGALLGNGTVLKDGNPIFSAQSDDDKKYIRIVQLEPKEDEKNFLAWMKYDSEECFSELTISCAICNRTEVMAKKLIEKFVIDDYSVDQMNDLIINKTK